MGGTSLRVARECLPAPDWPRLLRPAHPAGHLGTGRGTNCFGVVHPEHNRGTDPSRPVVGGGASVSTFMHRRNNNAALWPAQNTRPVCCGGKPDIGFCANVWCPAFQSGTDCSFRERRGHWLTRRNRSRRPAWKTDPRWAVGWHTGDRDRSHQVGSSDRSTGLATDLAYIFFLQRREIKTSLACSKFCPSGHREAFAVGELASDWTPADRTAASLQCSLKCAERVPVT